MSEVRRGRAESAEGEADVSKFKREFKLTPGEPHLFDGRLDEPDLTIVGDGPDAYLWVGGKGCVGTLHGKDLRKLAAAILAALARHPRAAAPRET